MPRGYSPGTAWIQVLPSFDGWHKRSAAEMAKLGDVKIDVEPNFKDDKVRRGLKKLQSDIASTGVSVDVDADTAKAEAKIRTLEARRNAAKIAVDADISKAEAKIALLESRRGDTTINVDAEIAKAQAKIRMLEARRNEIDVQVDADIAKATAKLGMVEGQANRLDGKNVDINIEANDASRAIFLMGGMVAAIGAVGAVAPAAAAAVAAIPAAIGVAAQGVTGLVAGFSGIGDAVKAMEQAEKSAATTSSSSASTQQASMDRIRNATETLSDARRAAHRAHVTGAQQVADAMRDAERTQVEGARRVADAVRNADRTQVQGAQQVRDARQTLADVYVSAARRVQDAERTLESAQRSAKAAQDALNQSRVEARERIEDLRISLAGAALDEESAVIALERANERLAKARKNGLKGLDLREAELGARQAAQRLVEVRERYGDLRLEANKAARSGVEGDRSVVSAKAQVREALRRVRESEEGLRRVRADSARDVTRAQEAVAQAQADAAQANKDAAREVAQAQQQAAQANSDAARQVARAQQQAAQSNADAARRVARAQADLAAAYQKTGAAGKSSADKVAYALSQLSPAGQRFAKFIHNELKPALKSIGAAVQTTMLPRMETGLRTLMKLTPLFSDILADTGRVFGDLTIQGANMMNSGPWRRDFRTIGDANNRMLETMGGAGLDLADAFRSITVAALPMMERFANFLAREASQFNQWIQGLRNNNQLGSWFRRMGDELAKFGKVIAQVVVGFAKLADALSPIGGALLSVIGNLAELIGNFAEAHPVLANIIAVAYLAGSAFVSMGRGIGGVRAAVTGSLQGWRFLTGNIGRASTAARGFGTSLSGTTGHMAASATATSRLHTPLSNASTAFRTTALSARNFGIGTSVGVGQAVGSLGRLAPAVTPAVGAFGRLRSAASGAVTGGLGRIQGAATTWATGMSTIGNATRNLGVAGISRLRGAASSLVGFLGGPWGVVLAGAAVALSVFTTKQGEASARADQHRQRVQTLTDAIKEDAGAIGNRTKEVVAGALADRNAAGDAKALGISFGAVTDAAMGSDQALKDVTGSIDSQINSIVRASGGTDQMAESIRRSDSAIRNQGKSAEDMIEIYQGGILGSDQFTDAQKRQLVALLNLKNTTFQQNEELKQAQQKYRDTAAAMGISTGDAKELAEAQQGLADKYATTADKASDLNTVLDKTFGKKQGLTDARASMFETLDGLRSRLQDTGFKAKGFGSELLNADGSIRVTTENGRALNEGLKRIRANAATAATEAYNLSRANKDSLAVSFDKAYAEAHTARQEFIKVARQFGLSRSEAAKLADQVGLLPGDIALNIATPGMKLSQKALDILKGKVLDVPNKWTVHTSALTKEAMRRLAALGYRVQVLPDGTVKITANTAPADRKVREFYERVNGKTVHINVSAKGKSTSTGKHVIRFEEQGGILAPMAGGGVIGMARGGFSPMSGRTAEVVPPNTWRVIGDRMRDDEAFIPINHDPRSLAILAETAKRMGFALEPLANGGLLAMAKGGTVSGGASGGSKDSASLKLPPVEGGIPLTEQQIDVLTAALPPLTTNLNVLSTSLQGVGNTVVSKNIPTFQRMMSTENQLGSTTQNLRNSMGTSFRGITSSAVTSHQQTSASQYRMQSFLTASSNHVKTRLNANQSNMNSFQQASWSFISSVVRGSTANQNASFNALMGGMQRVRQAMTYTADWAVGAYWRIREAAARPVRWTLDHPFNRGLIAAWNKLNRDFNFKKHVAPFRYSFASGGYVRGPGTGTSDSIAARLSNGEFVVREEITKRALPFLKALNAGQPEAMQATGGRNAHMPGYARGGLVADTGSALNAAIARGLKFARAQNGKPYIWTGVGPRGYDCSGFQSAITNVLTNRPPHRRLGNTASMISNPGAWGFRPGLKSAYGVGVYAGNPGHTAGTLAGLNVEAGGSPSRTKAGPGAAGAQHGQFTHRFHLPVVGGRFIPGGGPGLDPSMIVNDAFRHTYRMIGDIKKFFPNNEMANTSAGEARRAADRVKGFAHNKLSSFLSVGAGAANPQIVAAVRAVARQYGWGSGPQWDALYRLIDSESSWKLFNPNPVSTADGLFQKMQSIHGPVERTAAGQARWGLNYIRGRHTDPIGAWRFKQAHNWYDDGGWLPPGSSQVYNGTGKPEPVLTRTELDLLTSAAAVNSRGVEQNVTVNSRTDASPEHIAHVVARRLKTKSRL